MQPVSVDIGGSEVQNWAGTRGSGRRFSLSTSSTLWLGNTSLKTFIPLAASYMWNCIYHPPNQPTNPTNQPPNQRTKPPNKPDHGPANSSVSQHWRQKQLWGVSSHLHSVTLEWEARCPGFHTCLEGVLGWIAAADLSHMNPTLLRASLLTVWAAEYCYFSIYFLCNNLPLSWFASSSNSWWRKRPFITKNCSGTL